MPDLPTYEHPDDAPDYVPGEVILRVHPDAVLPYLDVDAPELIDAEVASVLPEAVVEPLDYLRRNAGLRSIGPALRLGAGMTFEGLAAPAKFRQSIATSVLQTDLAPFSGLTVGLLPERRLTSSLLKHVGSAKTIDVFERVPARWLTATSPTDPTQNRQWGLRAIRWFRERHPETSGIRVGIIDSGIDAGHPAFEALAVTYRHLGATVPDVVGHGTHIAGTIGAATDNAAGIAGMTQPELCVWKALPDEPDRFGRFLVAVRPYLDALYSAATSQLTVLNLSLAGTKPSDAFEQAALRQVIESGANVVAAMGNGYEKGDPVMYPASYDGVFSVGSMTEDGRRSAFSGTGRYIDLIAPGSNVLSVVPRRRSKHRDERVLDVQSGTSMATAHVSAALALTAAERPGLSAAGREERLRETCRKLSGMRGRKWTKEHGYGLLDVDAALS